MLAKTANEFRRVAKADLQQVPGGQYLEDDRDPGYVYVPKFKIDPPRSRSERRKLLHMARNAAAR